MVLATLFTYSFIFIALGLVVRFLSKTSLVLILVRTWQSFMDHFHVYQLYKVPQYNDHFQENQLYNQISTYLNSLPSVEDSDSTNLFSGSKSNDIFFHLDATQSIRDTFLGARVCWTNQKSNTDGIKSFVLKIKKNDKKRVFRQYFQHILSVSDEIGQRKKEIKLHLNLSGENERWRSIPFTHPANFETVVVDAELKTKIKSDLELFLKSKQYYHRLGRVWKRSYLLYGASGTGKTSFIAAMARFLCYDVYDIDISKVSDDSDLKTLLLQTTPKSLIVVEDLDRFLTGKRTAAIAGGVSLSGLLNFMDGIISSCGEERVLVFTMNSKDHQIDQSVMRPGRIDVHIHFPLCDFSAFKGLANNYLGLKEHKLFPQVEEIFQTGASLSPAEIGELMISNRTSPSRALKSVISALQSSGTGPANGASNKMLPPQHRLSNSSSGRTGDESVEPATVFCRENMPTVSEFKKLYGLLRLGSRRKEEPMVDLGLGLIDNKEGSRHEK
ncbi:AAA-ATPase At2g46620 [Cannabis sativa]|uniref:AAA-ATPase At2g46620 n=1 Tax=Cannabis sativa TaxID=3483 RepID=UPI0029CA61DE|nr:AAA-ATPase At2g46620 [Cannabis sativa]